MVKLIMTRHPTVGNGRGGGSVWPWAMYNECQQVTKAWPGVKQWNVWFNDTIFGRYRDQQHLHEMEVDEVEEETDDHMDATALSFHEELEALVQPVSIRGGSDDSTGPDEQQQTEDQVEGASVEADHSEPELQADSGVSEGTVPPLAEGSVDTPKPHAVRKSLALIDIKVRS